MADVGKREQDLVLRRIEKALPPDCRIQLLGSSAALEHNIPDVSMTKDVDLSIVVLDGEGKKLAPMGVVESVLGKLQVTSEQKPEDESWVKVNIPVDEAKYRVDFIRGKSRDRPHGTFIERSILEDITSKSRPRGRVLLPSLTDLIVMKAWAAVDQTRLAEEKREEAGRFGLKAAKYLGDVRAYTETAIRRGQLDEGRIRQLLEKMAAHRRGPVEAVLRRGGALNP